MSGKAAKRARRGRTATPVATFWHGGPPGLTVGTVLRPITALAGVSKDVHLNHPWYSDIELGHVTITTDRALARDYAARWNLEENRLFLRELARAGRAMPRNPWADVPRAQGGALYRVMPLDRTSRDPDYPRGVSMRVATARITAVEEADVPYSPVAALDVLHYQRWDDESPLYDAEGYALPSPRMREWGMTAEHLRVLGYAPHPMQINQLAERWLARGRPRA